MGFGEGGRLEGAVYVEDVAGPVKEVGEGKALRLGAGKSDLGGLGVDGNWEEGGGGGTGGGA